MEKDSKPSRMLAVNNDALEYAYKEYLIRGESGKVVTNDLITALFVHLLGVAKEAKLRKEVVDAEKPGVKF